MAASCRQDVRPVSQKASYDPFLRLIAVFKLIKSVLFICAGIGLLHLLNRDVEHSLQHLLDHLHVDPDNRYAKEFLDKVGELTNTNLKLAALSIISFFYAALFGVEGVGLFLGKRWAEWLVVIITCTLFPLEIYEIFNHVTALKLVVTAINVIIVIYLIVVIWRKPAAKAT
jgi:uncharacterized membrane protein (DUF2068 family)